MTRAERVTTGAIVALIVLIFAWVSVRWKRDAKTCVARGRTFAYGACIEHVAR